MPAPDMAEVLRKSRLSITQIYIEFFIEFPIPDTKSIFSFGIPGRDKDEQENKNDSVLVRDNTHKCSED